MDSHERVMGRWHARGQGSNPLTSTECPRPLLDPVNEATLIKVGYGFGLRTWTSWATRINYWIRQLSLQIASALRTVTRSFVSAPVGETRGPRMSKDSSICNPPLQKPVDSTCSRLGWLNSQSTSSRFRWSKLTRQRFLTSEALWFIRRP
jgi:hypothetical protein